MAVQMQAPDGRVVAVETPVLVNQLKAQGYTVVAAERPEPEPEPEPIEEPLPPVPAPADAEAEPEGQFHSYAVSPSTPDQA